MTNITKVARIRAETVNSRNNLKTLATRAATTAAAATSASGVEVSVLARRLLRGEVEVLVVKAEVG